jgi:3-hydroxyacyl-CoA dehydrogenase/enoyl-CoA hydratase/3-hydroxybutyryl-CoA epimerase
MQQHLALAVDADGVLTVTLDVPGRTMNVITPALECELAGLVDRIGTDATVRGVLITSAKPAFSPGYDLAEFARTFAAQRTAIEFHDGLRQGFSHQLRRLETCGKPVAVAIGGLAMGGGFELCLAGHYRVLADDPKAVLALPEVKVGLLPGAGGTQRLPRLIGIEKSLPLLLEGTSVKPADALKLGIVDELAPKDAVVAAARRWLLGAPVAQQPWDRKGWRVPGGKNLARPDIAQALAAATALVAKTTQRNYPAPRAILECVFEGIQVPIDRGLEIERMRFAQLATGPVARNLIRTTFLNKGRADKLERRPAGVPPSPVKKVGILGAGMMGAGIAYASAQAGIDCVLLDATLAQAEQGRAYSANLLKKQVERGVATQAAADALLARIRPTADYADLAGCDLVVEAVFEHRGIKADVTAKAEAVIPKDAIFASNTSTLPITGLAEHSKRPKQFVGIHFFSPVEKMPLVEIIVGRKTGDAAVAKALDYVGQLRKTPIVVNDARGFYTSRVFGTYCYEGQRLLAEGVEPALIENAARQAGMPVGPLAVSDEVSLELQYKVIQQTRSDLGAKFVEPVGWPVLRRFVEDLKRLGRKSGGGFYDYPDGQPKRLWPGLAEQFPRAAEQPSVEEVKARLLYVQALETVRCYDEGVVTTPAEADLGSVFGWGFPAYTGGTLSFVDTIGVAAFTKECERLAKRYGERFKPPRALKVRARRGEPFHATPAAVDAQSVAAPAA